MLWFRSTAAAPAALLLSLLAGAGSAVADEVGEVWSVDVGRSRLTVTVLPAGLLASALHPHLFRPEDWSAEIAWDPSRPTEVRVDVRIAADSLRDHQPKLSARDIEKVERQVRGPDILDAERFPAVLFEGRQLEGAAPAAQDGGQLRATLVGTLALHGASRPIRFPVRGRVSAGTLEASGKVAFRQSDFGIRPYSTALGTIAVKDEVTVEIFLVAAPRSRR